MGLTVPGEWNSQSQGLGLIVPQTARETQIENVTSNAMVMVMEVSLIEDDRDEDASKAIDHATSDDWARAAAALRSANVGKVDDAVLLAQ